MIRAADLAARFEVSVRTVERDLLALQEAGVPVWAQRGPNGGYTLDPRTTLPPLNLTAREAVAVAIALSAAGPIPFAAAGRSARRKLLAAMSAGSASEASALADRVRIEEPGVEPADPKILHSVEDAVDGGRVIEIDYVDREGAFTQRAVEAHGLYGSGSGWYLVGWCRMRDGARIFRLDRIRAAHPTAEKVPKRDIDGVLGWVPSPAHRPELE